MAEAAGLVLGGIPLIIWALEKYAEPLEAFANYRTSIESLRASLVLQNKQFRSTLSSLGLGTEPSRQELQDCFYTKFPDTSHELIFIVQHMESLIGWLMKKLDIDFTEKANALPDKAQWEWRRVKHSLSKRKLNKVVQELRHLNEDLKRCLEKTEVPAEDDSHKIQHLKRRFNAERCNFIRQCIYSFHGALQSGFCCSCSEPHQAAIGLGWEGFESDAAKHFKVVISYGTNPQLEPSESWRKIQVTLDTRDEIPSLTPKLLTPSISSARAPSPASYLKSKKARFELPSHIRTPSPPPIWPVSSRESTIAPSMMSNEIVSLCDAICGGCHEWAPSGILKAPDKDKHQQFVLSHDQMDAAKVISAVSLKSLLSSHQHLARQQCSYFSTSAKQRYGIAASIAWSVLHLSGSPWLGDDWDKHQTKILIEKGQSGREMLSRHPYASYIFTSATTPKEPAMDDFKHLIPNRTIFALGIILIELCINKSFAEIQQTGERSCQSLLDSYETALRTLDDVYRVAGDSYGYAVERCVKFSFQGRDLYKDFDFAQFRQQFHDAVVAPVQATYLMFPDSHVSI